MIMVTHDQELANRIPRKIEIVNGRIHSDTSNDYADATDYTDFAALPRQQFAYAAV
jgi:ABC-type lipoprotein export system ATPase subunit